jgi:hypothetical protein
MKLEASLMRILLDLGESNLVEMKTPNLKMSVGAVDW